MGLMETINYYYYDLSDERVRDWLLMDSIWYPVGTILTYLFVVFILAPAYMRNRPAYKLNTYIRCYNLFQIFFNAYIITNASSCYHFRRVLQCRPAVYSTDYCGMLIVKSAYMGLWLKIIDLSETVIYVLRKKNNQVSFLHLYHHLSSYLVMVICVRYFSIEVFSLPALLNGAVHVIMYSYYFLSNFEGPIKQMIIPFKRYLTLIQMGQFVIIIIQILAGLIKQCDLPQRIMIAVLFNIIFNFWLFFRFYKQTYIVPKKKAT